MSTAQGGEDKNVSSLMVWKGIVGQVTGVQEKKRPEDLEIGCKVKAKK